MTGSRGNARVLVTLFPLPLFPPGGGVLLELEQQAVRSLNPNVFCSVEEAIFLFYHLLRNS